MTTRLPPKPVFHGRGFFIAPTVARRLRDETVGKVEPESVRASMTEPAVSLPSILSFNHVHAQQQIHELVAILTGRAGHGDPVGNQFL